jgi:GDPmannose 4,6-dehydratase
VRENVAVVTGAGGHDGYFLTRLLLVEGMEVHATVRPGAVRAELEGLAGARERLTIHEVDLLSPGLLLRWIEENRPGEFYNLAGQSSVSKSFEDPLYTWRTNVDFVSHLLETVRQKSPLTRVYQASSTDMFGFVPGGEVMHTEESAFNPQSPYAAAKAATHLLCKSYRSSYNLRIASGILSNHESRRRTGTFLSRKVVDHVRRIRGMAAAGREKEGPLVMGNLKMQRDWGYAPDYVAGMTLILRQIGVRAKRSGAAEADEGRAYRDYVLGTGRLSAVWELVDRAFALAGMTLAWRLEGDDPMKWHAVFPGSGALAVRSDRGLLRPADPLTIRVDPARAREELGFAPRGDLDGFLGDMLEE